MLELKNVEVSFKSQSSSFFKKERQKVLKGISFKLTKGHCLGIIGESGSGKSTTGRVLTGLLKPDKGSLLLNNKDVYKSKEVKKELKRYISIVFQDYTSSVNPRFTVKKAIAEGFLVRNKEERKNLNLKEEIIKLLDQVGLNESFLERYPHELSGGQLQRVCIARALATKSPIILFDEAISSLDSHTQVQLMDLLIKLKEKYQLTYIFISHDLTAITYICDEIVFFKDGHITQECECKNLSKIKDDYAKSLLLSVIDFEEE